MQFFDSPYHRFHKIFIHCAISVFVATINPTTKTFEISQPFIRISHNIISAHIAKCGDTILGNDSFCSTILLFFNRCFCRQAMTIPTQCAFNIFSMHCLITRDHIFDRRHPKVSPMWQPVWKRWTIIETKRMPKFCFFQ